MRHTFSRLVTTTVLLLSLGACGTGSTEPDDDSTPGAASLALGKEGKASVAIGGTTTVPVSVDRSGGFTGAITIAFTGLPTGVTASNLTIPSGQGSASVLLTAAASAPRTPVAVSVGVTGTGAGIATTGQVFLTLSVRNP
ncbi:MAG: hypothetical protein IT355_15625 [Gemmatimonadaceae bacterium]|nr:hypothetical protein [Gemmatimonadaceae bacterium]